MLGLSDKTATRITPLKKIYDIEQLYHSHQANFISFILKGVYIEDVIKEDVTSRRYHKWFNYLTYDCHHKVVCDEPCYTLMFMGRKKSNTTVKLRGKKYGYNKFFKLNDEEKI